MEFETNYLTDEGVPTVLSTWDFGGDNDHADFYCPNDLCPGIEVVYEQDMVAEVIRVAWGGGTIPATRYQPAEVRYDACPTCGESGERV